MAPGPTLIVKFLPYLLTKTLKKYIIVDFAMGPKQTSHWICETTYNSNICSMVFHVYQKANYAFSADLLFLIILFFSALTTALHAVQMCLCSDH